VAEKGNQSLIKIALQIQKSIELSLDLINLSKIGGEQGAYGFMYNIYFNINYL